MRPPLYKLFTRPRNSFEIFIPSFYKIENKIQVLMFTSKQCIHLNTVTPHNMANKIVGL